MIPRSTWKIRGGKGFGSASFLVAGIVNVTPDSFSDGGLYNEPADALARCDKLVQDGAAILDIGGESTRPGAAPVSAQEELNRLMPVVEPLAAMRNAGRDENARFFIAVDTYRASVAAAVLEAGADIVNDISGASFDPAMREVLGQYKPGYVLTHTPSTPENMMQCADYAAYPSVVDAVREFFESSMAALVSSGLPEENIVLDPGIGFGKTAEQNRDILRHIAKFYSFGRPLYVGVSRKRMFGDWLGLPLANRDAITQVAAALLAERGVYVHRVHDVAGAVAGLRLAEILAEFPNEAECAVKIAIS
ncbi:dihydropteroate synthase [Deltaproteobacteria bacterium]|nr:dihydropteroate synthase [Deltaproteobacteria bacterium]